MDPQRSRLQDDLRGLVSGEVRCDQEYLSLYSGDGGIFEVTPLSVVLPQSESDVVACLKYAVEKGIPVTARGAGTGLAGESLGSGILLDFSYRLRRIISMSDGGELVHAEAGIVRQRLNEVLGTYGRLFGPDPAGPVSTLGSAMAINGAGSHWLEYGLPSDHVQSLRIILADGRTMEVGREPLFQGRSTDPDPVKRALINDLVALWREYLGNRKANTPDTMANSPANTPADSSPPAGRNGYSIRGILAQDETSFDLARLICGSEGTLALISTAMVRTVPIRSIRGGLLFLFDRLDTAAQTAVDILQTHPQACDLLDRRTLSLAQDADSRFEKLVPGEMEAAVLVECTAETERELSEHLIELVDRYFETRRIAKDVRIARDRTMMERFWRLSSGMSPSVWRTRLRPVPGIEDAAVPPEQVPKCVRETQLLLQTLGITASLRAHVGHGGIHLYPMLNLNNVSHAGFLRQLAEHYVELILRLGGTLCSEHGHGLSRTPFLKSFVDDDTYRFFQRIKQRFDPTGVLNPGHIVAPLTTGTAFYGTNHGTGRGTNHSEGRTTVDSVAEFGESILPFSRNLRQIATSRKWWRTDRSTDSLATLELHIEREKSESESGSPDTPSRFARRLAAELERRSFDSGASATGDTSPIETSLGASLGASSESTPKSGKPLRRASTTRDSGRFTNSNSANTFALTDSKNINEAFCSADSAISTDAPRDLQRDLFDLQVDWNPELIVELTRPCTGCGDCRDRSLQPRGCPVFRINPLELSAPRAMVNLTRGVLTGQLPREVVLQRAFHAMTDHCIQCRLCSVNCPARVDVATLVSELKGAYVAANGLSLREWFICRPDLLCGIASRMSPVMRGAMRNRWFRWFLDRVFGVSRQRRLPKISSQPFLRRAARHGRSRLPRRRTFPNPIPNITVSVLRDAPSSTSHDEDRPLNNDQHNERNESTFDSATPKVAYFVDISANWNDPQIGEALEAILDAHKIPLYVPPDQVPSGSMAIRSGAFELASSYVNRNLSALSEAVRQGYTILTTEPAAALTLKRDYPTFLGGMAGETTGDEEASLVSEATQDACQFLWNLHLAGKLQTKLQPIPERIGYYAPCVLRAMDIGLPSLELLRLIPELRVKEIEAGCCGMAGLRGVRSEYFRESLRIGWNLASQLRDPDYTTVVTECGSCRMQIEQMSGKTTCHPIRLLASALGLMSFSNVPLLPERGQRYTKLN